MIVFETLLFVVQASLQHIVPQVLGPGALPLHLPLGQMFRTDIASPSEGETEASIHAPKASQGRIRSILPPQHGQNL